jgi:L-alanine-DL-glutamate epimerase-like enolase superfamily enzyme
MLRELRVSGERWPLAVPFRIARGIRTESEVVYVELSQDGVVGRGEGVPIARYVDTVEDCIAQIEAARAALEGGASRRDLMSLMKAGAARNAVDCATWDLEARLAGRSIASLSGRPEPGAVTTAMTVSLDAPAAMEEAARRLAHLPLVKVKVNGDDPAAQIRAARRGAPDPVMVVDCNEGWTMGLVRAMQPVLVECDIALLEQPLPAAHDEELRGFSPDVPICADESCHTAEDLERLDGLYQAVNIKLDKTGGLTAALDLLDAARERRLTVMMGCMICTSLSIAPAFHVAARSDFADLDGPTWLAQDRPGGVRLDNGLMTPPSGALWGG